MFGFNPNKIQRSPSPKEDSGKIEKPGDKETKKEKIFLEIDGQKLEGEKYYFEYPKNIQEETGILGYERTKILNESLIERVGTQKLLLQLSNGKYPNLSFTHQMGGFALEDHISEMSSDFIKDKFFLQKIYDINTIERKKTRNNDLENILNYSPRLEGYTGKELNSSFSIFNNKNELIKNSLYPYELPNYKDSLKTGELFIASRGGTGGINTLPGRFWGWGKEAESLISFGFPMWGEDQFFTKYLEESLKIFSKLKLGAPIDSIGDDDSLCSLIIMYCMSNYKKEHGDYKMTVEYVHQKISSFILENPESPAISSITDFWSVPHAFLQNDYKGGDFQKEITEESTWDWNIPILIGNKEIPQLSWGHAKYAHYFNEKGLNFFEFKHADHLPKPKDFKESKKEGE